MSRRTVILASVILFWPLISQARAVAEDYFEWPETRSGVIADVRLASVVEAARSKAREAKGDARKGRQAAAQAQRRLGLRNGVGLSTNPVLIDSGTQMRAIHYYGDAGPMIGQIEYADGAKMWGVFGQDIGIYEFREESLLESFEGWVFGATRSAPQPSRGVFTFRNGDVFVGDWQSGVGIFKDQFEEKEFVGLIDFQVGSAIPVQGILLDDQGDLVGTVIE